MKTLVATIAGMTLLPLAAQAATLNLTQDAGRLSGNCSATLQRGIRATNPTGNCMVTIPLPVEAGRTIKQVSVFYGAAGSGPSTLSAYLERIQLKAVSEYLGEMNYQGAYSATAVSLGSEEVAAGELMRQVPGLPTRYPDAFVVKPDNAYYVTVMPSQDAEFFGIRVIYE